MRNDELLLEKTPCPLCSSENYKKELCATDRLKVVSQKFDLVRCCNCGLLYQNPRVRSNDIGRFYPEDYFKSRPGRNIRRESVSLKKAGLKANVVENSCQGKGRLLEIGSANGDFLVEMRNRGWDVEGIEVSENGASYSSEKYGLNVHSGTVKDFQGKGPYDAIVLWGVLPHFPDPLYVYKKIFEMISPKGKLIACFANEGSLAMEMMGQDWSHLDQPRHYCMWSEITYENLLSSSGFRIVKRLCSTDLWASNIILPQLQGAIKNRGNNILSRITRKIAIRINEIYTRKIEASALAQGKEAIVTVIAERCNQEI